MEEEAKPLILILCTGNYCRSHIEEVIRQEVDGDVHVYYTHLRDHETYLQLV